MFRILGMENKENFFVLQNILEYSILDKTQTCILYYDVDVAYIIN